jgi:hypothetical protein
LESYKTTGQLREVIDRGLCPSDLRVRDGEERNFGILKRIFEEFRFHLVPSSKLAPSLNSDSLS